MCVVGWGELFSHKLNQLFLIFHMLVNLFTKDLLPLEEISVCVWVVGWGERGKCSRKLVLLQYSYAAIDDWEDDNAGIDDIDLKKAIFNIHYSYFGGHPPIFIHGHWWSRGWQPYLIFVIFFTRAKFLENNIYTKKLRKLRQNTQ